LGEQESELRFNCVEPGMPAPGAETEPATNPPFRTATGTILPSSVTAAVAESAIGAGLAAGVATICASTPDGMLPRFPRMSRHVTDALLCTQSSDFPDEIAAWSGLTSTDESVAGS
jgi:hypothetical protein